MPLLLDAGVIWSFAVADGLALLETASVDLDLTATFTVRNELGRNMRHEPALRAAVQWPIRWFHEHEELEEAETEVKKRIERTRLSFAVPGDGATKHLGESGMIEVARQSQEEWILAFEDGDARRRCDALGLDYVDTIELLRWGHQEGIDCNQVVAAYQSMLAAGRLLPVGLTADDLCR